MNWIQLSPKRLKYESDILENLDDSVGPTIAEELDATSSVTLLDMPDEAIIELCDQLIRQGNSSENE